MDSWLKKVFRKKKLIFATSILIWSVFLSGFLPKHWSGPGLLQAFQLYQVWKLRKKELSSVEYKIRQMSQERSFLKTNPYYLEQYIRNQLGYVAPGELVFELPKSITEKKHLKEEPE